MPPQPDRTTFTVQQADGLGTYPGGKSADLEAVLMPGDTVLADSLERGWYRVALEGEVLGYVHRSTLTPGAATEPPEVREDRPGR